MAKFPAMPLWTDALLADTGHLTNAQFGAYLRLLIVAWRRPNCDLPDDDEFLGRAVGDPRHWPLLRPYVRPFFQVVEKQEVSGVTRGRFWTQQRLLREYDFVSRKMTQRALAGRASALKRLKQGSTTVEFPSQRQGNENSTTVATPTPTPTPTSKKAINGFLAKPDTPEFKAWQDYANRFDAKAFARELKERAFQGRAFNFETQWPPDHGKH